MSALMSMSALMTMSAVSTISARIQGGPRRARTGDPRIKSPMLYQLS